MVCSSSANDFMVLVAHIYTSGNWYHRLSAWRLIPSIKCLKINLVMFMFIFRQWLELHMYIHSASSIHMYTHSASANFICTLSMCILIILKRESIRCRRESIRCRRESIRCRNRAVRPRFWWQRKIPTDGREKSQLMAEKNPNWWKRKIPIVIIFENGKYPMQKGKYPMQKGKYPMQEGKYPMQEGKYPMQDPCRNGLVSDGRKKPRLMEEKNPDWWQKKIPTDGREKSKSWFSFKKGKYPMQKGKYPIQKGKYPMQKGKYPIQKPCRKGLVSDGRKKSRLMEEKNPNWWQKKSQLMEE